MAKLEFEDLRFNLLDDVLRVRLYKIFYFDIPKEEIERALGNFIVKDNSIESERSKKFNFLLAKYMPNLKNSISGRNAVYIHENLGLSLIGNISFGIIDRNSSLIEVKPITSCVLNCIYCSVNEGRDLDLTDYVIEEDYLVKEVKKIVEFKGVNDVEVHLNAQGEPLLYSRLTTLVKDISSLKAVSRISIDTNGVLLTKEKVDSLLEAGLTRFNVSLNAIDKKVGKLLSGNQSYDVDKVMEICKYIQKKSNGEALLLAPILVPGINDEEIKKVILFGKEIHAKLGVQNYLEYKHGRKPVRQLGWDKFFELLDKYEKELNVKLKLDSSDFNIKETKKLPKPFRIGEIVEARIVCPGRFSNEVIVEKNNRSITVITNKTKGLVKFKIIRTKHNIFLGR